ncbi:MAG TPA: type II toxin-antitoxin system RelE/ParE family toxin [Hansschlegelia sp.]
MKVRYTIRAERHLKAIAEHIAQDSLAAAGEVVSGIKASVERLERFPESGRVGGQGAWQLPVPRLPSL